jgi:flavorubredoxin
LLPSSTRHEAALITNAESRTAIDEIAADIYRIHTPVDLPGGQAFSFNQYLLVDDEPLLFHTGPRRLFALTRAAMASVLPVDRLRHVAFSHTEADECGALNEWLAVAPNAAPLCSRIAAMVSIAGSLTQPSCSWARHSNEITAEAWRPGG